MKALKYFLSAFLIVAITISCIQDELGSTNFVSTATAPTNITALFNVTQDNTGTVTITPNGDGAISYDIYFGDGTTEPAKLNQGKSVTHVFAEGSYEVKIIAYGITGLKAEVTQPLVVSFKAPENLAVTIENDLAVSKQVNVTATADYGLTYDVYFGEPGNDTPVTGNIGETVSYVYQNAGTYTIRVVAKSAAIATTEYTEDFLVTAILQPLNSAPTPEARIDTDVISIFSDAYTDVDGTDYFPDWGQGGQGSSWAMFDLNGDSMLQYINLSYQGIQFGSAVDASSMEFLHVDVWTPDVTGIDIFPIDGNGAAEKFVHRDLVANQWNSFDIPLTEFTDQGLPINDIIQFKLVASNWAEGTVFMDNIYFYKSPTELIQLPINFESSNLVYTWEGFGDVNYGPIPASVVTNPDQSGMNTSSKVVEINKTAGAQTWAGASMNLSGPVDFSAGTTITVKVWSPRAGVPILFKMEDSTSPLDGNGNPTINVEVQATTTVANQWEELSFDLTSFANFSASNLYDRVILFPDFGNVGNDELFYFDDIEIASVKMPITFEVSTLTYTWEGFGDANYGPIPTAVVTNPDQSGVNVSGNVVEINKTAGAQTWAGASMNLDAPVDFSNGTTVKVKVWSPRAGVPILFKMEDSTSPLDGNGNPTINVEVQATTTVANQWEELSFDLTSGGTFSTANSYDRVILFPDFGNTGNDELFYFDDILLTN
ncbi:MAG: hypothetical protein R3342_12860 [Lutibacter sp.]|uniref:hypothetical protein n=1 Tax=Lutibacter sp. TaxID=1925666 RepID=UPI00299E4667|nr:hypothetical protein [Lutibacter sp.]MDX1830424.1 hypothetical protein [Lutibacter sp.]